MSQFTMLSMLVMLQILQLLGFSAGLLLLSRKVQAALDRRSVSLWRLALSAASSEHAQVLRTEVQLAMRQIKRVEAAVNQEFLRHLLEQPIYRPSAARAASATPHHQIRPIPATPLIADTETQASGSPMRSARCCSP